MKSPKYLTPSVTLILIDKNNQLDNLLIKLNHFKINNPVMFIQFSLILKPIHHNLSIFLNLVLFSNLRLLILIKPLIKPNNLSTISKITNSSSPNLSPPIIHLLLFALTILNIALDLEQLFNKYSKSINMTINLLLHLNQAMVYIL